MTRLRSTTFAPAKLIAGLAASLIGVTLLGGAIFASNATAQEGTPEKAAKPQEQEGEHAEGDEHHGKENHLHESMEVMQRGMKGLRRSMTDPEQKDVALELCVEMEAAALTGFLHPPASPDGLEGAELRAYQADFKKRMLAVTGKLVDLELAIDKGEADSIKQIYKSLGMEKKEGHNLYIKD